MIHGLANVLAVRVQFAPDVVDFSVVPDAAGSFGLLFATYGAARRFEPDRLGRLTLFGNLLGGTVALTVLLLGLAWQTIM